MNIHDNGEENEDIYVVVCARHGEKAKQIRLTFRCNGNDSIGSIKRRLSYHLENRYYDSYYVRAMSNYVEQKDDWALLKIYPNDNGFSQVQFIAEPYRVLSWEEKEIQ